MLDKTTNPAELSGILPDFLNAARGVFSGQLDIRDRNDRPHYDRFIGGIVAALAPATALEQQLAFSIAADSWRLNRVRNIEDGIFALCHPNPTGEFGSKSIEHQVAESQTSAFLLQQSHFKFLSTYEMRLQRTVNRNKAELKELQAERRAREAEARQHQAALAASQTSSDFAFSESAEPLQQPAAAREFPARRAEAPAPNGGNGFAFSNRASSNSHPPAGHPATGGEPS